MIFTFIVQIICIMSTVYKLKYLILGVFRFIWAKLPLILQGCMSIFFLIKQ